MAHRYSSTARKRKASSQLRALASELGVPKVGRNSDLNRGEFDALLAAVVQQCKTPDHRGQADELRKMYTEEQPVAKVAAAVALPTLPAPTSNAQGSASPTGSSASRPAPGVVLPPVFGQSPSVGAAPVVAATQPVPPSAQANGEKEFRLRGTSCLFTYNSPLFLVSAAREVWEAFSAFIAGLPFVSRWTATLEQSLHALDDGRVHLHAFVEFCHAVDWTSVALMVFRGSRPDAKPTRARGADQRETINQGHFYAWAWKQGTLFVQTSGWEPWVHYPVKGWWIDSLWTAHKLSHATYLEYAAQIRVGFINRQRHVDAIIETERAAKLKKRQQAVALRLAPMCAQFKGEVLHALAPWRAQYHADAMRYKFLVLRGGSRTGKSTLAKGLGNIFGLGCCFVQTVQNAVAPDLKQFSNDEHGYILFDNVNDMEFVLSQRALFQANNDLHTLGDSKTGIYAYQVWLYKMPIVVTVDLSAYWEPSEPWIKANCFDVFLPGPCY